jgi:hypothetical protein
MSAETLTNRSQPHEGDRRCLQPTAAAAGPDTAVRPESITAAAISVGHGDPAGLTQKQTARLLGVSVGWLRASTCPKVLLPGNGPKGKPMLRYFREDVLAWAKGQDSSATLAYDGTQSATPPPAARPGHGESAAKTAVSLAPSAPARCRREA